MVNTRDKTRFPEIRYCVSSGLDTDSPHRVTVVLNGNIVSDHNFVPKDRSADGHIRDNIEALQYTNIPPSVQEVGRLSAWRSLLPDEIHKLEAQNHVLQASIGKLCHRLAENRSTIDQKERDLMMCNRLLSPMRRVPLEILHQIFLHCKGPPLGERRPDNLPIGIVIGHVCHFWRQASLHLPLLWNNVEVVCSLRPTNRYSMLPESTTLSSPRAQILALCFQRSQPLPLTISIRAKYHVLASSPVPLIHSSIVKSITSVAHRVENLVIQAESRVSVDPLISCPPGTFPVLKALTLEINNFEYDQVPITIFETCTSLDTVTMDIKPIQSSFKVNIPWGQLTHLDMLHGNQPISDSTWRVFIRLLHKLQDGRFCLAGRVPAHGFDHVPFISNPPQTILLSNVSHLPDLHTLTIRFVGQELPQNRNIWLLRNLDLSAIRNFHFSFVRASTLPSFFFWKTENLQLPLFPYLQNLKSLTLWSVTISILELIDLLKMTVALERFRVKAAAKWTLAETRKLVNALMLKLPVAATDRGEDGLSVKRFALAPSLTNLVVWVGNLAEGQAQSYLSMVTARRLDGEDGDKHFKMTLFCRKKLNNVPEGVIVIVEDPEAQGEPEISGTDAGGSHA